MHTDDREWFLQIAKNEGRISELPQLDDEE